MSKKFRRKKARKNAVEEFLTIDIGQLFIQVSLSSVLKRNTKEIDLIFETKDASQRFSAEFRL